jgi:N-hydroxyarylamine O-acetyltransferase
MTSEFRIDDYLARIGFRGSVEPNFATLAALHFQHVNAIPFEGLDPLLGLPVNLDLGTLQRKLVHSRRGGYCFEQNILFKAVLETIGFKVTGLTARVLWMSPPDSPLGPKTHMLLKVDLPDGPRLADVGFGVCVMDTPLTFQTDIEQRTAMGTYRLSEADGMFCLSAIQPAGWRRMYTFNLEPQIHSDYEIGSWFAATHPAAPFSSTLIMERLGDDKRYKLVNRKFKIEARDGQSLDERTLGTTAELREIFEETFNVVPPVPVEQVFSRLPA